MGNILNAICKNCGFVFEGIYFGQGMIEKPVRLPALHKDSGRMVVAELSDDPSLQFYHQREMYKDPIPDIKEDEYDRGISWGEDIVLNPQGNLCPSCNSFSLAFEVYGNWD